jgi:DNA-binding Xre family transcriptional regulator
MGVLVRPEHLEREMVRRGWTSADLARFARVSPATVTAMRTGKAVSPHSVHAVARALASSPPLDGIDGLLY